jgi:hypothetical protein
MYTNPKPHQFFDVAFLLFDGREIYFVMDIAFGMRICFYI